MRDQWCVGLRVAVTVVFTVASLFVFGASPVRAQTAGSGSIVSAATAAVQTQGGVRRLSIDEAVALALEQNVDLQVDRIDPQLQDYSISLARSNWTPAVFSNLTTRSSTNPPQDIFGGADIVTNERLSSQVGVQHLLPFGGGNYQLSWLGGRGTSNNVFSKFNPSLDTLVQFNFTQPLLRNFTIDSTRQQVLVTRKNREISDIQLQQSIVGTTRNVRNAYWDLVFAINNLAVQRQSLELAQQSFRENRARVEIGTMAPLDIVQAEAEVARGEEAVIIAEAAISRAEDTLRALIANPVNQPEMWNTRLEPADLPEFKPIPVDANAAVSNALANRTDLISTRKQIESQDISIRFYRNQSMPDVNAVVNYSAQGLAGTQREFDDGFPPVLLSESQRGFFGAFGDAFGADFPTWSLQLQVNYPIGSSNAEVNHARARLQRTQQEKNLQSAELQVTTQIRNLARNVQTNSKRVEATRAARALAERRLEAEEKKFTAGMTSSFFVTQAQRDLAAARNSELQAIIDYLKSVVDYETAQQVPLGGGGGGLVQVP